MEVPHGEDVASHTDPEPCVMFREEQGEASAGDRVGRPLSRVSAKSRAPTGLPTWKATHPAATSRVAGWSGAVRDPGTRGRSSNGNREIS